MRTKLDKVDTILPLLKDLAKQKDLVNGEYLARTCNHVRTSQLHNQSAYSDAHSSRVDMIEGLAWVEKFLEIQKIKVEVKVSIWPCPSLVGEFHINKMLIL